MFFSPFKTFSQICHTVRFFDIVTVLYFITELMFEEGAICQQNN